MLPATISPEAHDALHDEPARWYEDLRAIAHRHRPGADVSPTTEGTCLVAFVGRDVVLKVYPPFLHSHYAFERAALGYLAGRLTVAVPEVVGSGDENGWPYLLMTRLEGLPFEAAWRDCKEAERLSLMEAIGRLMAEVHAMPPAPLMSVSPLWRSFVAAQRRGAAVRHRKVELPEPFLSELETFLDADVGFREWSDGEPPVVLTGEYTPQNLLVRRGSRGYELSGLFDFGDGLVGPRDYDFLGPSCFLASGDPQRLRLLMKGYGSIEIDELRRGRWMRLLLLHRYSNLRAQLQIEGWARRARSLADLAQLIWPETASGQPQGSLEAGTS